MRPKKVVGVYDTPIGKVWGPFSFVPSQTENIVHELYEIREACAPHYWLAKQKDVRRRQ
jgi:hypothetical protein